MSNELVSTWEALGETIKRAAEMVEEKKKPNADGLIVAVLQVIAWELRTAREERYVHQD